MLGDLSNFILFGSGFKHFIHEDTLVQGQIPSIKGAARQLKKTLRKLGLSKIFVSTDAPKSEVEELGMICLKK